MLVDTEDRDKDSRKERERNVVVIRVIRETGDEGVRETIAVMFAEKKVILQGTVGTKRRMTHERVRVSD